MVVRLSDFLNTSFSTLSANDTNNTGVTYPGTVAHGTTLTPGVGIGTGLQYRVETSNNNEEVGMLLETVTTDVTAGSEDFDFVVKLMQNGATASEKFRVSSSGLATTNRLNVGTVDNTYVPVHINGSANQGRMLVYRTAGTNRWEVGTNSTAESGSNVGSNYAINRYSDTGTFISTSLSINRSTGAVFLPFIDPASKFGSDTTTNAFIVANAVAGGQKMFNLQTAGLNRWLVGSSAVAEGGANTGSNFDIYRYSDAGTFISTPFTITRATGLTTIAELSVSSNVAVLGRSLVGTSSPRSNFLNASLASASLQVEGTDATGSTVSVVRDAANANPPRFLFGKSRGTTVGSNALVQSGDGMGSITFQGNDGAEFVEGAVISATVDGTAATDSMPGRLEFSTANTIGLYERVRIDSTGNVLINRTTSTVGLNTKLDINGAVNAAAYYVNGVAVGAGDTSSIFKRANIAFARALTA